MKLPNFERERPPAAGCTRLPVLETEFIMEAGVCDIVVGDSMGVDVKGCRIVQSGRCDMPAQLEFPRLPCSWEGVVEKLDFHFQPIVNSLTGACFALEALVRNCNDAGFCAIGEMFNAAWRDNVLYSFDVALRSKAIGRFARVPFHDKLKLFYNYDPRVHEMPHYRFGVTDAILREHGLQNDALCFELSEQHRINSSGVFKEVLRLTRRRGFSIALDDFGAGFSSFELFYHTDPDFLKFDRFLISGIDTDAKKRVFCSHIISLAKLLGVIVIAEGVETEKEFLACRELGVDLVQGYYIQRPTGETGDLREIYDCIRELDAGDRRKRPGSADLVRREIELLDPIGAEEDMSVLFSRFNRNSDNTLFPVLDSNGFPLGIIHERSIKKYIYSPFGYHLLQNRSIRASLEAFVEKCPIVDINTREDKMLEVFVSNPDCDGVIITADLRYAGFLKPRSLLNIINERNLTIAREVNPLTKLPGNVLISRHLSDAMRSADNFHCFIYFDFDYFKPFNDRFGFRQGDRAILMFSEMLSKEFQDSFVGHIGGDDFFVGINSDGDISENIRARVMALQERFEGAVAVFFSEDEVRAGGYTARDRSGCERVIPLLKVTAAMIVKEPGLPEGRSDEITRILTRVKSDAKRNNVRLACVSL